LKNPSVACSELPIRSADRIFHILGKFQVKGSEVVSRELQVAIPAGSASAAQKQVFANAAAYAEKQHVKLIVTEIK
jgi:hypothetical protein